MNSQLIYILFVTLGSTCFAILFSIPKKELLFASMMACLCASTQVFITFLFHSQTKGNVAAALVVAAFSIYLANTTKKPMTIFLAPGIIPLLPGYYIYKSILSIIENSGTSFIYYIYLTLQSLLIIALSIIIASSVRTVFVYFKKTVRKL